MSKEKTNAGLFSGVSKLFRNLSIAANLSVYTIYLIYLIYSINAGLGILAINISLAALTAIFMVTYVILRLSDKKKNAEIRKAKKYYKNFKLFTKIITTLTAIYAIFTAINSVSPFAIFTSILGAIFLAIRIIIELVLGAIKRKIQKVKKAIAKRFGRGNKGQTPDVTEEMGDADTTYEESDSKKDKKWKKRNKKRSNEDIVVSIDDCVLTNADEQ